MAALRRRRRSNKEKKTKEQTTNNSDVVVDLEGDVNHKWSHEDIVFAKYLDYPWWPAQIVMDDEDAETLAIIKCKWFGSGFSETTNECHPGKIIEFDPNTMDKIFDEIEDVDVSSYVESCDDANSAYLTVCKQRNCTPLASAVQYAQKNKTTTNRKRSLNEIQIENENENEIENKNTSNIPTSKQQKQKRKQSTTKTNANTNKKEEIDSDYEPPTKRQRPNPNTSTQNNAKPETKLNFDTLYKMKVKELKDLCRSKGLKVGGA